jgi:hypothetical protein
MSFFSKFRKTAPVHKQNTDDDTDIANLLPRELPADKPSADKPPAYKPPADKPLVNIQEVQNDLWLEFNIIYNEICSEYLGIKHYCLRVYSALKHDHIKNIEAMHCAIAKMKLTSGNMKWDRCMKSLVHDTVPSDYTCGKIKHVRAIRDFNARLFEMHRNTWWEIRYVMFEDSFAKLKALYELFDENIDQMKLAGFII